jgi:hypothetical protein
MLIMKLIAHRDASKFHNVIINILENDSEFVSLSQKVDWQVGYMLILRTPAAMPVFGGITP